MGERVFQNQRGLQSNVPSLAPPPPASLSFCSCSNLCVARMRKSSLYWNACYVGLLCSDYQLTPDQNDV